MRQMVLSMQLAVYIKTRRLQHGNVPMPVRLPVQHFLQVILLTAQGLAETLLDW